MFKIEQVELVKPSLDTITTLVNAAPITGWEIDYEDDTEIIQGRTAQMYILSNNESNPEIQFTASRFIDNGELAHAEFEHGISLYLSVPGTDGDTIKDQTIRMPGMEPLMTRIESIVHFRNGVKSRIEGDPTGWTDGDLLALGLPKRPEEKT